TRRLWMGLKGALPPNDDVLHAAMIAYISDMGMLGVVPRDAADWENGFTASLDHAVWFHRKPRFDDWLLYSFESPMAEAARALVYGTRHARDGVLLASTAQEGLVRPARPWTPGEFR